METVSAHTVFNIQTKCQQFGICMAQLHVRSDS